MRVTDLARYETLVKQNAVPEQTRYTQRALVDQMRATVKPDQAMINSAKAQPGVLPDHGADHRAGSGCAWWTPETSSRRYHEPGGDHADPADQRDLPDLRRPTCRRSTRRCGRASSLNVDAWDRENTQKLATGKLTTIDNQIDQTTGSVRMRANFDNPTMSYFPTSSSTCACWCRRRPAWCW